MMPQRAGAVLYKITDISVAQMDRLPGSSDGRNWLFTQVPSRCVSEVPLFKFLFMNLLVGFQDFYRMLHPDDGERRKENEAMGKGRYGALNVAGRVYRGAERRP
jgi:hypothetical protein